MGLLGVIGGCCPNRAYAGFDAHRNGDLGGDLSRVGSSVWTRARTSSPVRNDLGTVASNALATLTA
jgi:hypothetical protein